MQPNVSVLGAELKTLLELLGYKIKMRGKITIFLTVITYFLIMTVFSLTLYAASDLKYGLTKNAVEDICNKKFWDGFRFLATGKSYSYHCFGDRPTYCFLFEEDKLVAVNWVNDGWKEATKFSDCMTAFGSNACLTRFKAQALEKKMSENDLWTVKIAPDPDPISFQDNKGRRLEYVFTAPIYAVGYALALLFLPFELLNSVTCSKIKVENLGDGISKKRIKQYIAACGWEQYISQSEESAIIAAPIIDNMYCAIGVNHGVVTWIYPCGGFYIENQYNYCRQSAEK